MRIAYVCPSSTFRAPFARVRQGWEKRYGGQAMTWPSGMKKLASILALIGASSIPGYSLNDEDCCWLGKLKDVSEWKLGGECCVAGLQNSSLLNLIRNQPKITKCLL